MTTATIERPTTDLENGAVMKLVQSLDSLRAIACPVLNFSKISNALNRVASSTILLSAAALLADALAYLLSLRWYHMSEIISA